MENATTEINPTIEKTFEKLLFPTPIYTFVDKEVGNIKEQFFELTKQRLHETSSKDLMDEESPCIEHIKQTVYAIANQLPEFADGKIPVIIGSNLMFQENLEHIPVHAYEHIPIVFSFIMNSTDFRPKTYYVDPRGGVQTISRNRVKHGIVETSFGLYAYEGEVVVTPGYLQKYIETNLSQESYVVLDVLVGFNA